MGHRYIGAKTRILDAILEGIARATPKGGTVADIMSGTGSISLELRLRGYKVVANDIMRQAYHITRARLLSQSSPQFSGTTEYLSSSGQTLLTLHEGYAALIQTLNNLEPIEGYFWREFSPQGSPENGTQPRKYFSSENAKKIDACRSFIATLHNEHALTDIEHSILIHDLIMAANDIANIAGTYGHFLSKFVPRALEPIEFSPMKFVKGGPASGHTVMNGSAEDVASAISADLCYVDPPYKKRQYAANYHVLETIAKEDFPPAVGRSGLRPWRDEYSDFCSKVKIRPAFEKVVKGMNCPIFLISYSSEGLLTKREMLQLLEGYGTVDLQEFSNKRFKSRDEQSAEDVTEYLFLLRRRL